jgi:hypothetical protein
MAAVLLDMLLYCVRKMMGLLYYFVARFATRFDGWELLTTALHQVQIEKMHGCVQKLPRVDF